LPDSTEFAARRSHAIFRLSRGFAAFLDTIGIKYVEDLQIFFVASADLSLGDGSV
jgi:hypothetical protein